MIPIFKDLVRKEVAMKEDDIYRSSFFPPTKHHFPKQMILSATRNFLGKMSIYFSDAVIAQSTSICTLSSYLWIGSISFSILLMVAKLYPFTINAFL